MVTRSVLLTGARGFIGGAIARRPGGRPGIALRAASRRAGPGHVRLEVTDPATLVPALEVVDAGIHCAVGDAATTLAGTGNLLAGARRFVHVSSVSVYAATEGVVDKASPPVAPARSGHAHWKAAAELECEASGLDLVLLRPAIVHGAGSGLWVGKMGAAAGEGLRWRPTVPINQGVAEGAAWWRAA